MGVDNGVCHGFIGHHFKVSIVSQESGQVFINGELWRAECEVPLAVGGKAVIESIEGLTLKLKPYEQADKSGQDQYERSLNALDKKNDA